MLGLIACMSRNRVIGSAGKIPWRCPEDMAIFKSFTLGHTIVMGRRTWESLPKKPLPDRRNIVITSQTIPDIETKPFSWLKESHTEDIFVIGGEQLYQATWPFADYIFLTTIKKDFAGDTFFPTFTGYERVCFSEVQSITVGPILA